MTEARYDIVVIGGGIAGISAAARLAPHANTLVLEAEDSLGYHASGRSAAMFEENYGLPTTVALNRASRADLVEREVLTPRGLLLVAGIGDEDRFDADLSAMGLPEIDPSEAAGRVPILRQDRVARAAFHDDAWDIDTDRLIQSFAKDLRAHGGDIRTNAQVTRIERHGPDWLVGYADSAIRTSVIVNASGAWADRVATLAGIAPIGLTPCRRSMARLPAPGGQDVSGWPMVLAAGEAWYAKPDAGKLLVSPGDEDPVDPHDAWADDLVIAEGLARYEAMVTDPVTRVEVTWAGLRTFAPDRSLVIGPEPGEPTFLWCAGQGGYGMQTSPAVSACLAAHITGWPHGVDANVVQALLPGRFR